MASKHGAARRNMIGAHGRTMTLRRPLTVNPATYQDVVLLGFTRAYRPEQMPGDVRQGDQMCAICANEITAAGWPAPPRPRDLILVDGRSWAVLGAQTIADGAEILGWDLWIRGGM